MYLLYSFKICRLGGCGPALGQSVKEGFPSLGLGDLSKPVVWPGLMWEDQQCKILFNL